MNHPELFQAVVEAPEERSSTEQEQDSHTPDESQVAEWHGEDVTHAEHCQSEPESERHAQPGFPAIRDFYRRHLIYASEEQSENGHGEHEENERADDLIKRPLHIRFLIE